MAGRFAGNKSVIRTVSSRFNMAECSYFRCADRVMDFLCSIAQDVIKFPTSDDDKLKCAKDFEEVFNFNRKSLCCIMHLLIILTVSWIFDGTRMHRRILHQHQDSGAQN